MKTFRTFRFILFIVMTMVGLEVFGQSDASMTFDPDGGLEFDASGGEKDVTVITANVSDWAISSVSEESWVKATRIGDKKIHITVQPNPTDSPRNATISVSSDDLEEDKTIRVHQNAPYCDIFDIRPIPATSTDNLTCRVSSNARWKVEVTSGDWLELVSPADGMGNGEREIVLKPTGENTSTTDRNATVTITNRDCEAQSNSYTVTQLGAVNYLSVVPTSLLYNPDGSTQKVTVWSNVNWTVSTEGGNGWLTVTPTNGSKDGELTVTAIKNSGSETREATITVTANGLASQVIKVKQTGSGYLNVGTTSLLYNPDGATQKVTVVSNVDWTVATEGGSGWLTVTPPNGSKDGELTVTAIKNNGSATREATITVTANGLASQVIKVKQTGSGYLNVGTTSLLYNPDGATQKVTVTSNVEWTVSTEGGGGWLTVTPPNGSKDGELTVTAIKNSGSETREATITVKANGLADQVIKVTQKGYGYLNVGTTSLLYNPDGATQKVTVTSNVDWTVATEGGSGWLTVTPPNGSKDGELTVTAIKNSGSETREATITVMANGLPSQVIKVKQGGSGYLNVGTTSLLYNPDGATQKVTVVSNVDWTVATDGGGDWLTVSPISGNGDGEIRVTVPANPGGVYRLATITVTASGLAPQVIKVRQGGSSYLNVGTTSLLYNPDGATQKVSVTSNLDWTVATEGGGDWLTVTPPNGSKDGELTVTAIKNTGSETREATITVTANGLASQVIKVKQAGSGYLNVGTTSLLYNPDGATQKVTVTSNVDWTVATEGGGNWLTVTPPNGSKDGELTVTAIKNTGSETREATITVTANGLASQVIKVKQTGSGYLNVGTTSLLYNPDGATQKVTVTSNVDWTVATEGGSGWLTVTPPNGSKDGELTVTAIKNSGSETREATITVMANGLPSQVIKVKQGGSGYLNVGTTSLLYNPDGATQKVTVTSNVDWTVATEGGGNWLTVTPANGSKDGELTVTAIKNSGSETREATITVTANGLASQVIKVKQTGSGYLNVGTTSLLYNPDGATQKVTVTSNVDWTVATEGGSGWLTVTPPNGSKDGELTVTAIKNSGSETREATITVMANGLPSQVIKVKQTGSGYLNVGTTSLLYNPDGATQKVSITSNVEWTVATEGGSGWLTVTPANGSKDGELTVTAIKNTGSETREATITIMANGLASQVIKVKQTGSGYLNVGTTSLLYNPDGATQKVTITSNVDWTVATEGGSGWLTVTPPNGSKDGELTVTAIKNNGSETREATITVTANGLASQVIKVKQTGSGYLNVGTTSLLYNPDGATQKVTVTSNVDWTVSTEGGSGWLTVTPSNGSKDGELTVTAIKNTGSETREATITVMANGLASQVIKVKQTGSGYLNVGTTSLLYNPDGATQKVTVTSNVDWTVATEGGSGWLTVTPNSGNGNDELTVTASENTGSAMREATITVSANGQVPQVIKVTQSGSGYLNVGTTSLLYNPDGATQKVTVTSNVDWTVATEGGSGWLTVTPNSGNGNDELTVTASENTGSAMREATIIVSANGQVPQVIKVTQSGSGYLNVGTTSLLYNPDGATQKVTVTSNVDWTVATEGGSGWLTVTPNSGNGNDELTVTASENTGSAMREATITVSANGQVPQVIKVTQSGSGYLNVGTTSLLYNPDGATQKVTVTSNVDWTVATEGGSGWLTVTPNSGNGNDELTVTASENTGSAMREATITVSANGQVPQVIKVTQSGSGYLNVDKTSLLYNPDGATQKVTVTSNVDWTVFTEGGGGWLTVSPNNGSGNGEITVTATSYTGNEEREATITISANGQAPQIIKVSQTANQNFTVSSTELNFTKDGKTKDNTSEYKVSITTDVSWKVEKSAEWLHVEPLEGNGNGVITVTVDRNEDWAQRTATIKVSDSESVYPPQIINVIQSGNAYLKPDTRLLKFKVNESDEKLSIKSNAPWEISIDDNGKDWLSLVSPEDAKGNGDKIVSVHADFNSDTVPRKKYIYIDYRGPSNDIITDTIRVEQERCPIVHEMKLDAANILVEDTTCVAIQPLDKAIHFTLGDENAKLEVNTAKFDNPSKWLFNWTVDNKPKSKTNELDLGSLFKEKKAYSVKVEAEYEDAPDSLKSSLEFYLYPCPKCPDELVMKGNGSSGIMIATLIGTIAFANDYKYVFGYGDDDDIDGTTSTQYHQYKNKSVVRDVNMKKWVYTQWDISTDTGNESVESINRRYVYKEGETGNEEVNTRSISSDPTSITNVECGEIKIVGGRLIANVASPANAVIDIISVSGNTLRRIQLPASTTFNETIDTNGLPAGICVVKCTVGDKRIEQKMVIK